MADIVNKLSRLDLKGFVPVFARNFVNLFTYFSIEQKHFTHLSKRIKFLAQNRLSEKVNIKRNGLPKKWKKPAEFRANCNQSIPIRSIGVEHFLNCKNRFRVLPDAIMLNISRGLKYLMLSSFSPTQNEPFLLRQPVLEFFRISSTCVI